MLEAILLLSLERVVVSGKSIAHQDTDVITFAKDLFRDTHPASSPESEKRNVLCEKSGEKPQMPFSHGKHLKDDCGFGLDHSKKLRCTFAQMLKCRGRSRPR